MTDTSIFQGTSSRMETMSKNLGFDIPTEQVHLPSAGTLYPVDHPFCNAEEGVQVRSMTAREEDLLTSPALLKSGMAITKLIESCLVNKGVDIDSLLIGDRDALLIAIRVLGYGEDHKAKITCPDCDKTFEYIFKLNRLPIRRLGLEPVIPNQNLFNYELPLSKLKIEFKLLTVADTKEMDLIEERKKKAGSQLETRVTGRLLYNIVSINGEKDRGKISTIISNLRAGDSRALRQFIHKIEPGIDMTQEATCKHCSSVSEVNVPLGASFFWPDFGE